MSSRTPQSSALPTPLEGNGRLCPQKPGASGSAPDPPLTPADCLFARSPQYLLDSNSWIEEMPSERMCQSTRHRTPCAQLKSFLQAYGTQGCQV